jgi:glycosidase
MHDVMRFWLRKGVDGFRVDVIWRLIKDDQFRNNPVNPGYAAGMPPHQSLVPLYTADLPAVQDIVNGLRRVIDEFADRLLIGEIYLPIERLVTYYGCDLEGLHLPFNFALLHAHWDARTVSTLIDEYEAVLPAGGWPNWVLENHDHARIASRIGNAQARIAAMLLLTLRGTPTIYYGDEIGMLQVPIPLERVRDPFEKTFRESESAAMARGRRCNGTPATLPGSRQSSPGYPFPPPSATTTSRNNFASRPQSTISLAFDLGTAPTFSPVGGRLPAPPDGAQLSTLRPAGRQRANRDRAEFRLGTDFDVTPTRGGIRQGVGIQFR